MGWVVNSTPRPLYLGKQIGYTLYRTGGPQGRYKRMRKTSPPPGFDTRTVPHVATRYNSWAIFEADNFTYPRETFSRCSSTSKCAPGFGVVCCLSAKSSAFWGPPCRPLPDGALRTLCPGVKWPKHASYNSPAPSTDRKSPQKCTSIPPPPTHTHTHLHGFTPN
jgi:hypothetical protein